MAKKVAVEKVIELDEAILRCRRHVANIALNTWDLGKELSVIHEDRLWQVLGMDGLPRYKSWAEFVKVALGVTAVTASNYMRVSKNFSRDEVNELGHTKLLLASRFSVANRPRIMKLISDGCSMRDLYRLVGSCRNGRAEFLVGFEKEKPLRKVRSVDSKTIVHITVRTALLQQFEKLVEDLLPEDAHVDDNESRNDLMRRALERGLPLIEQELVRKKRRRAA